MAIIIGFFSTVFLSFLIYLSTFISASRSGFHFRVEQIVQSVLAIALFFVVKRLLVAAIWNPYEHIRGKPLPRLFIDLTEWFLLSLAVICITVLVFDQPVASLMTFGGLVSAGIAFSLQSLILDLFSGIVLDIERPYEVKDWIKVGDGQEGMVTRIGARTTTIVTYDNTTITLPHGKLAQGAFTNYSKPTPSHWEEVKLNLDHAVPIDRAERLMRAAIAPLKEVHQGECRVWACAASTGCITYTVRYLIAEHTRWHEARHAVLLAITKQLSLYGLRLAEVIGGYTLSRGNQPFKFLDYLDKKKIIRSVALFETLDEDILEEICTALSPHLFHEKGIIIKKEDAGDSMFIVAEGVAEVIIESTTSKEPLRLDKKREIGPHVDDIEHDIKSVKLLHAGNYFGEMALLLGHKRSATVRAKTDVILFEISKEMMTTLLKAHPDMAVKMSDIVARRQVEMTHALGQKTELDKQRELASTKILEGMKAFFDLSL